MKQVLQDLSNGETTVVEAPTPAPGRGQLLLRTTRTLVSAGTERMLVDFGRASYIDKARQQPEKVKQVLDKVRTDGLLTTVEAVRSKLGQPIPLGYCHVGVVHTVGPGVDGFQFGDRVVSNGPHADMALVPKNLCVRIPDSVSDDEAAFVVLSSIGLQGIRLAQPTLGESVAVIGAGLIGLMTIQLLVAQGCRVLAIDLDSGKLALARQFGAETCKAGSGEDPISAGLAFSRGQGIDAVLITASTSSSDPVTQAARMSRKRGRIVLVGVTGLELNRADFYEKELSFQVSCSYGPGRYDPVYEQQGHDYPLPFVRWTEQRNFQAVLDLMAGRRLDVDALISHRFAFEDAPAAYEALTHDRTVLGMLLEYPSDPATRLKNRVVVSPAPSAARAGEPVIGFIGAGNYGARVLIPAFRASKARLHTICSSGGVSAVVQGTKAGFEVASTDVQALLEEPSVNTVVIASRHDSHASLVARSLDAGKSVFVEKPLCLTLAELTHIERALADQPEGKRGVLMVGFNRRFSPHVVKLKSLLDTVLEPKSFVVTVNAGRIPAEHWTQDPEVGGGRLIGEACHFIDLLRFLAGSPIASVRAIGMGVRAGKATTRDTFAITIEFEDGSLGSINYLANGSAAFPKERIEAFTAGRVLQIDNFRALTGFGWPGFKSMKSWRQDKGQNQAVARFLAGVRSGDAPIPLSEILEVARWTIEAAEQLKGSGDPRPA
ncbi:MAG: bi-domain-containing oxidoreductase [Hydrogenophaga sp.]|uniref:bi-domain-containing oxidoreductase n=1 Tax=Hydrogenophaga sp. TaxID=1904254 RepID=UPI00260F0F76|nr:bi-domain-containing oxidoreductase [Hydrogenophaga sp.]MDM7943745.1 bi-domain-containing oxidoreductase [Hydrogenophaga sp.]